MKAIVAQTEGGPEVLAPAELAKPQAGPGQVLVRMVATSVNPVDTKIRAAMLAMAPETGVLGCDVAGVAEAVGEGVTAFAPGDAVFGCAAGIRGMDGALAQYAACDARLLAHRPGALDFRQAAAIPLVGITAWEALVDRARIGAGDHVLIHGGAGGVGHVAIQIAKAHGARVAATVSTEHKADIARGFGADEIVFYRDEAPEAYVARLTGGAGFDVVFDATGGSDLATSFAGAREGGQVVTIVSRYSADLNPMHAKGLTLHVVFMLLGMRDPAQRARQGAVMRALAGLAQIGALRPLVDPARFALDGAADAHRHLESGAATGKVVIDIADA